jgi:hypothetical protein
LNQLKEQLDPAVLKTLSENFTTTATFIDKINSNFNVNKDELVKGNLNDTLVEDYKKVYTPIFEQTKQIQDTINKTGSTPELEAKLNANIELINTGTSSLLSTIAATDNDIKTNSGTYTYLSTDFTTSVKAISGTATSAILSNVETIAAGADKTNLSKALAAL